jgi:hypothetical protein
MEREIAAAATAAHSSFKKHITPQIRLLTCAFRFDVRLQPVSPPEYNADFFGVSDAQ